MYALFRKIMTIFGTFLKLFTSGKIAKTRNSLVGVDKNQLPYTNEILASEDHPDLINS